MVPLGYLTLAEAAEAAGCDWAEIVVAARRRKLELFAEKQGTVFRLSNDEVQGDALTGLVENLLLNKKAFDKWKGLRRDQPRPSPKTDAIRTTLDELEKEGPLPKDFAIAGKVRERRHINVSKELVASVRRARLRAEE